MQRSQLEQRVDERAKKAGQAGQLSTPSLTALRDALVEFITDSNHYQYQERVDLIDRSFCDWAEAEGITSTRQLAESNLVTKLLPAFLDTPHRERFVLMLSTLHLRPYTNSWLRRSLCTESLAPHVTKIVYMLKGFMRIQADGRDPGQLLRMPDDNSNNSLDYNPISESYVAAMLLQGDKETEDYLAELLEGDNTRGLLERFHLRVIAMSGNKRLLEAEGRLLLAARLQEGLRQSILETADEGHPDAYRHILGVVVENDLQRFSSVKRSLMVSSGVVMESEKLDKRTDKVLPMMIDAIDHHEQAADRVASDDVMQIFLGLWGAAYYEVGDTLRLALDIVRTGKPHQVEAVMLWGETLESEEPMTRLGIEAALHWKDHPGVMAGAVSLLDAKSHDRFKGILRMEVDHAAVMDALAHVLTYVGKQRDFFPYVFPWRAQRMERTVVALVLCREALISKDEDLIDRACDYVPLCDPYHRDILFDHAPVNTPRRIRLALELLTDRSEDGRKAALKQLKKIELTEEVVTALEEALRLKYNDLRIGVAELLLTLPQERLEASLTRLLTDKLADRRLAALDMMRTAKTQPDLATLHQSLRTAVTAIARPTTKEREAIATLYGEEAQDGGHTTTGAGKDAPEYTAENGYGLYDPAGADYCPVIPDVDDEAFARRFELLFSKEYVAILTKLLALIKEHKDDEYTEEGEHHRLMEDRQWNYYNKGLEGMPFAELWQRFYETEIKTVDRLLCLAMADSFIISEWNVVDKFNDLTAEVYSIPSPHGSVGTWFARLKGELPEWLVTTKITKGRLGVDPQKMEQALKAMKRDYQYQYFWRMNDIIRHLKYVYVDPEVYHDMATMVCRRLARLATPDNVWHLKSKESWRPYVRLISYDPFGTWISRRSQVEAYNHPTDEQFAGRFDARYHYMKVSMVNFEEMSKIGSERLENQSVMSLHDYLRAYRMGLLNKDALLRTWMDCPTGGDFMWEMSEWYDTPKGDKQADPYLEENKALGNIVIDRMLDVELRRIDSETPFTRKLIGLRQLEGAARLIRLLEALGKDKFKNMGYNSRPDLRCMVTQLVERCRPSSTDNAATLKRLIKDAGITDERMVEAAMLNPLWLEMAEEALGWKGLATTGYFFIALSDKRKNDIEKAHIARYTPISTEDLENGAFDIAWFEECYAAIGKKRFDTVYEAAKYITSNNSHTRARKFVDAVRGKMKATAAMRKDITEKRNKDLLMSLCLIPLGKKAHTELLSRYRLVQDFLKESRQFGAQRQASEKIAVGVALQNLANLAGYGDVNRLSWNMETALIAELKPYLEPHTVDGVEVWVEIDADGRATLRQRKGDKDLKSVPAALKKHKYVEELKEVAKRLKDQHSRGRIMMEQAMEDGTLFRTEEVAMLMTNPVISPLLRHLVFVSEAEGVTVHGFFVDGGLQAADGTLTTLTADQNIRIAHPYDLYIIKVWSDYQRLLFDKKIKQPFKQVFRELYVATDEERETKHSLRYAGNQIQPQKTKAVLKGRRWIADYYEGLQKVYYKENIMATIYARADWFSPSDIEAPTLEWVVFSDRITGEEKPIGSIRPTLYSEVMRDVDLAVSVAHAGGVDPEASHTTMEMRAVLVQLTMEMLHKDNVKVVGHFVHVAGQLADYRIHLGSGEIHQDGGTHIAVLPVHSQHRGRLFLPFVDDDPKTAEILSKVILFAEDNKLKDPSITNQIVKKHHSATTKADE